MLENFRDGCSLRDSIIGFVTHEIDTCHTSINNEKINSHPCEYVLVIELRINCLEILV